MASDLAFQYALSALAILAIVYIITILVFVFTGIARRVILRIKQRVMYKGGKYVNVIFIRNNHVAHELFIAKQSDGSFKVDDKRYVINPLSTFILDGIPTQITHEGNAEPYNIFMRDEADDMSTAEIEKIIYNNEVGDLAAALKRYFPIVVIFVFTIILFILVSGYFNYRIYDVLVSNDAIKAALEAAKAAAQVQPR